MFAAPVKAADRSAARLGRFRQISSLLRRPSDGRLAA
jgi:hypothetical protein